MSLEKKSVCRLHLLEYGRYRAKSCLYIARKHEGKWKDSGEYLATWIFDSSKLNPVSTPDGSKAESDTHEAVFHHIRPLPSRNTS